jgi:hypothetical protein
MPSYPNQQITASHFILFHPQIRSTIAQDKFSLIKNSKRKADNYGEPSLLAKFQEK